MGAHETTALTTWQTPSLTWSLCQRDPRNPRASRACPRASGTSSPSVCRGVAAALPSPSRMGQACVSAGHRSPGSAASRARGEAGSISGWGEQLRRARLGRGCPGRGSGAARLVPGVGGGALDMPPAPQQRWGQSSLCSPPSRSSRGQRSSPRQGALGALPGAGAPASRQGQPRQLEPAQGDATAAPLPSPVPSRGVPSSLPAAGTVLGAAGLPFPLPG